MSKDWPLLTMKALEEAVHHPGATGGDVTRREYNCPRAHFMQASRLLHDGGARLLTLSAIGRGGDELELTYTFQLDASSSVVLQTTTEERTVDSLFSSFPAADFLEREVNTLFVVKFLGHPNLQQPTLPRRETNE